MRWAWLWVLLVTGCMHRDLRLPPEPWSPEQRVTTYNQLAATHEKIVYSNKGSASRILVLADGREVRWVEDVLPVVPPDSTTARNARRAVQHRGQSAWWFLGGVITTITGVVMWGTAESDAAKIGGPLVTLAGVLAVGVGFYHRYIYWHSEERAYESYDDDLAAALRVCVSGFGVVPCEAVAPPAPQPPPPPGTPGYYPSPLSDKPQ